MTLSNIKLLVLSSCLVLVWIARLYRWRWPSRGPKLSTRLDVARPREDATVAAALRRYAVQRYLVWFFALTLLGIPPCALIFNLAVLDLGIAESTTAAESFAKFGIACAATAPILLVPFAVWVSRQCARLARLVRHGDLMPAQVTVARVESVRRSFTGGRIHTIRARMMVSGGESVFEYAFAVPYIEGNDGAIEGNDGALLWARPGGMVRALTSGDERFAIVLSPTGSDHLAVRVRGWREVIGDALRPRSAIPQARVQPRAK